MEEVNEIKLQSYRSKDAADWKMDPIGGNNNLSKLSKLLAEDYGVDCDLITAKPVINGFIIEDRRIINWKTDGVETVAFLQNDGFLIDTLDNIMDVMEIKGEVFSIPVTGMKSVPLNQTDREMMQLARSSNKHNKEIKNQLNLL